MQALLTSLTALTSGLLTLSLQGSLVIGLVLLAQWLLRKHLSPRARYALWLLVVLRLMLPISLESSVSVFQHANTATTMIARAANSGGAGKSEAIEVRAEGTKGTEGTQGTGTMSAKPLASQRAASPNLPPAGVNPAVIAAVAPVQTWPWALLLSLGWLAGVVFLLARIIWIPLRLNRRLAQHETATPPAVFEILEQAKRLIGVNQVLPVVQSRAVQSPALLGFIRPWLLLPHGLVEKFSPDELRLVFLHELAHLKRRDIAVNWLVTLLQILHWFNPLVWYAFARMRTERELACDELALSFARAEQNQTYGHAIIKLLEGFARPPALPGLVGILEDQQQMNRRITMIAQFKSMSRWSAPAAGLLLVLGVVTLTDAQTSGAPSGAASINTKKSAIAGATTKIIASGSGKEASGTLSPDETMIAYVDWSSRQSADVFVKHLGTGRVQKLTSVEGNVEGKYAFADSDLIWSPDSRHIAYDWYSGNKDENDLRITAIGDGTTRVVKGYNPELSYNPDDWSADGTQLLCTTFKPDRTRGFVTVAVNSGEVRQLLSLEWNIDSHPRFSPDARFVAFSRAVDGNEDVYVLPLGGSQLVRLTDSPRRESSPVWSGDGRTVLFSSDRRGSWDLWGVRVQDGKTVGVPFVVKAGFSNSELRVTRQGNLAYRSSVGESDGYVAEIIRDGSNRIGKPKPIARSYLGLTASPTWSPDGSKVAYISQGNLICIQTLATGVEQIVDPGMRRLMKISWSPDGAWMGLGPGGPKSYGHHVFNLQTRELRPLLDRRRDLAEDGDTKAVGWTPDGKGFVMQIVPTTGKPYYEAIGLDRSRRKLLPGEPAAQFEYFDISPDGKRVAYATRRGAEGPVELSVSDRDLKNARVIANLGEIRNFGTFRGRNGAAVWLHWSPDGQCIAYFRNAPIELHVVAADGSWDQSVDTAPLKHTSMTQPPQWSPDGTKLAMTLLGESRGEIGVLENFLPPDKVAAK